MPSVAHGIYCVCQIMQKPPPVTAILTDTLYTDFTASQTMQQLPPVTTVLDDTLYTDVTASQTMRKPPPVTAVLDDTSAAMQLCSGTDLVITN